VEDRATRLQENEEAFRQANERFREAVDGSVPEGRLLPFLCECVDETCVARIELSLAEYNDVRISPARFVTVVGHPLLDDEEVVAITDRYQVAEKGASE
jgi:hypothetical protein